MIAILDYKAGNLTSVELAVKHIGAECVVTSDPEVVAKADRVIFPGVGAAAHCMENLRVAGLDVALKDAVASGKPVFAICIGIQLLFEHSEEDGGVDCLGILPGRVCRFDFSAMAEQPKIPQIGWNGAKFLRKNPAFADVREGDEFYFVHSYYVKPSDDSIVLAETTYGDTTFTSAIERDNLIATQFHPEKSGKAGLSILRNFAAM